MNERFVKSRGGRKSASFDLEEEGGPKSDACEVSKTIFFEAHIHFGVGKFVKTGQK